MTLEIFRQGVGIVAKVTDGKKLVRDEITGTRWANMFVQSAADYALTSVDSKGKPRVRITRVTVEREGHMKKNKAGNPSHGRSAKANAQASGVGRPCA